MGPDKTIEERVGVVEQAREDCQATQAERYKEAMKRIERIENKMIGALGIGVILILGVLANIAIAIFKK